MLRLTHNQFLVRYDLMDPKPMAVIQQLYYRLCVEQLPHYTTADHTTKKGQKSRSGYANLRNIHSRRDDALAGVLKQQVASNNAYPCVVKILTEHCPTASVRPQGL